MAYRGARWSDPFASKTTRNERFAQMSKQEQLIEQKKREIQAKLEDQKKKDTEEALKKLQGASGNSRLGSGNKSNSQSGQHKGNRKPFWKSQDQRWKRDSSHSEDITSTKVQGSMNIFSNDGSFLDQFKKLSGVKETKSKKGDDSSNTNSNVSSDTRASASTLSSSSKCDSDADWGTWDASAEKHIEKDEDHAEGAELGSIQDQEGSKDSDQNDEDLHNSERLGTSHWFQQNCISSGSGQEQGRGNCGVGWHGQGSPSPPPSCSAATVPNRSSSPYSPSSATTESKELVAPVNITAPTNKGVVQYSLPNIPPPPIMPLLNPPQQQFIAYSSPPPQLQSIPPLSSMQPHTIPTPPPLAPSLSIHPVATPVIPQPPPAIPQPPPTIQQPPPSIQPSSPSLPPHLMQHPLPLLQHHTVPPPGVLQTQGLATASLPTLMTPLLQHPVPPIGLPPAAPAPASACPPPAAVLSICATGTGVSPAAMGVMQASRPNGGQSSDGPADPAADEARNYLARTVAQCGDDIEQIILVRNPDDPTLWFLNDKQSAAYQQYRQLVEKFRLEVKNTDRNEDKPNSEVKCETGANVQQEQSEYGPLNFQPENTPSTQIEQPDDTSAVKQENMESDKQDQEDDSSHQSKVSSKRSGDESDEGQASGPRRRKRRSRWAPETEKFGVVPSSMVAETGGSCASMPVNLQPPGTNTSAAAGATSGSGHLLTKVTRTDPALIQYAVQAFGTSNLSEDDWKKAEDHYKINLLYQDMLRKRQELERLQRAGKFKYEYDSDEETDGGTWEHRLRLQEMEATQRWAEELTKKAEGKHHIGDFLPPDELERFLEKYNALKEGREPDLSDYKEYKLKEDNIGFQMLQKLGWTEGQGLGSEGHGIVDPVNKASSRPENQGLGVERPEDVTHGDDEYDAYRKRMMLAYRFRPNPLNNPRRPYY